MDAKLRKTDDHKATESVDKGTASKTSELRTVAKPGPNTVAPAIGEKVLFQSTFGGEAEEFRVAYVPEAAESNCFEKEFSQFQEREQKERDERVARLAKELLSFQEAEKQRGDCQTDGVYTL